MKLLITILKLLVLIIISCVLSAIFIVPAILAFKVSYFFALWYILVLLFLSQKAKWIDKFVLAYYQYYLMKWRINSAMNMMKK